MKVILTVNNSEGSCSYKYDLPKEYIEKNEFEQITLPQGDNFRFYSTGYVYRICEREWSDFDDPPKDVIENIISEIKK
jgi:hypothetical protein